MRYMKFSVGCLLMTCCLCGHFSGIAAADGLDTLYQRTFAIDVKDYASANGIQVAAGEYYGDTNPGSILSSANGVDWKQIRLFDEVSYSTSAITFFNGHFIVPGTDAVYTSTDGSSWTKVPVTAAAGFVLNDIALGNNLLIGVGSDSRYWEGQIFKSTDGVTWLPVASGFSSVLNAVAYSTASGTFAAVGNNGVIYTYQSGYVIKRGDFGYDVSDIAYGNGTFVAVGASGAVITSTNTASGKNNNEGTSWTVHPSVTTEYLSCVAYGNGTFVAGGIDVVLTSPDGITWTQRTFGTPASTAKIRFDGSKFIAVGFDGVMLTSPDGIAWTTIIPATPGPVGKLVTNGSIIIATGSSKGTVLTSPDGARWTARYLPDQVNLTNLAYGNGLFVGIGHDDLGNDAVVVTSPDGITWTRGDLGTSQYVWEVAYGNDAFVIVTTSNTIFTTTGTIFTSTDGATWIPHHVDGSTIGVTFKDGRFIVPAAGKILSSADGFSWDEYVGPDGVRPVGPILPGNTTSANFGTAGSLLTSSGYKNWRLRTSPFEYLFQPTPLGFGDNTFLAAGLHGDFLTSPDGRSWASRTLSPRFAPHSALFVNNSFILTGEPYYATWTTGNKGGMIFQSAMMDAVAPPAAMPEIDVLPKNINYDYVKRGESVTRTITIVNTWTGSLSASVALTGTNTVDYPITGGTCGQQNTLAPDESCTIEVTFRPTTAFTRSAQIVVTSNDPVTPVVTVPLTGVGLQPIITPPSPLPVVLPTVVYPSPSAGSAWIYNRGNDNLHITSVTITGSPELAMGYDCSGAIEADDFCAVQLACYPHSSGVKTATVTVTSDDPDHPVLVIPVVVNILHDLNQIRLSGSTPTYFTSLQAACDQAAVGATIEVEAIEFWESITVSKPITLKGGFDDSSYASSSGFTSVHGLIITGGLLTAENLVIL